MVLLVGRDFDRFQLAVASRSAVSFAGLQDFHLDERHPPLSMRARDRDSSPSHRLQPLHVTVLFVSLLGSIGCPVCSCNCLFVN